MKKFIEEYGFGILTAIVVIMLLCLSTPLGDTIGNSVKTLVGNFAEKTNAVMNVAGDATEKLANTLKGESSEDEVEMPSKGDLITIEGARYRVLTMNGTQAKVLAMSDATEIAFNESSITTSFNLYTGQKYEGSKLDNYLENNWYTGLSQDMKDAIVTQEITQNMFEWNGTPAVLSSWYKNGFTEADTSGIDYTLSKKGSASVGIRHVFALDVQDVIDYLGSSFTPQDLNDMFWQQRSTINKYIWLRSAYTGSLDVAFFVYGDHGRVYNDIYNYTDAVRPAFVIDLSKIEYTK